MLNNLPQRLVIVSYSPTPPLAEAVALAFKRLGVKTKVFHSWLCNTWYDRLIIHTVNHYAHTLRLVPKTVNLFEGHPKSHKEWRSKSLWKLCQEFRPDLVLLTGIQRFKREILAELQKAYTVFFWFTESEKRFSEIEAELPFYHRLYFLSSESLERAHSLGFHNASLLQHAVDCSQFHPMNIPALYDWCFVGQWHERRQHYVEGLAEVSKNFVIYGSRWRKHNWRHLSLLWRIKGKGIWGQELVRLYNQTKVVINISVWGDDAKAGSGATMRLLEVPACRVCLLTDVARDAARLLVPEEDFVWARNLAEMQAKLAALLTDEPRRLGIASRGYDKASRAFSYDNLVARILADWGRLPKFR